MDLAGTLLDALDEMKTLNKALINGGGQTDEYHDDRLRYEQLVDDTYHAFAADGDTAALDQLVRDHREALDSELAQQYDAMQSEAVERPHHHHL